ncbi:helix-turn-helix domain-containing protein, partial [bacterium]|nr:helix-turn-helix domain-containing protein [bacterium]
METLGSRIKRLRTALNLRPAELARLVGVPPQYIDNWENRGHRPSARYGILLAQALGITQEELFTGRKPASHDELSKLTVRELLQKAAQATAALPGYEIRRFPLLGEIAAGAPFEAESDETMPVATHVPRGTPDNCYFLRVQGDSMLGDGIISGDLVLIDPNTDLERINEQEIYAFLLNQIEVTLKRIKQVGGVLWMVGSNPRIPPIPLTDDEHGEARILGRLIKL